jgi:high-affinity K+ transport system ATPase subunit B
LTTTIETNKTIEILSNSVKIVVKCGDTNSLLANINLDNTGTLTMSNNEVKFL